MLGSRHADNSHRTEKRGSAAREGEWRRNLEEGLEVPGKPGGDHGDASMGTHAEHLHTVELTKDSSFGINVISGDIYIHVQAKTSLSC